MIFLGIIIIGIGIGRLLQTLLPSAWFTNVFLMIIGVVFIIEGVHRHIYRMQRRWIISKIDLSREGWLELLKERDEREEE
jgi:uncharacterized membrane protein HdeD (DUF308 family)